MSDEYLDDRFLSESLSSRGWPAEGDLARAQARFDMWSNPNVIRNDGMPLTEILERTGLKVDQVLHALGTEREPHFAEDVSPSRLRVFEHRGHVRGGEEYARHVSGFMRPVVLGALDFATRLLEKLHEQGVVRQSGIDMVARSLTDGLVARLSSIVEKTLVLEINVLRNSVSESEGRTPTLQECLEATGSPQMRNQIVREYPAMTRSIIDAVVAWQGHCQRLLERFVADRSRIAAAFGWEAESEALVIEGISLGAGDTHGGESVAIIDIEGFGKLVYKPHALAVNVRFTDFVDSIRRRGGVVALDLRLPVNVDCGEYGWQEHIAHTPADDAEDVHRFYWRNGQLLALFYLLGATDMHEENLIAHGAFPVPIDLETLFCASADDVAFGPAGSDTGLLTIGMLPQVLRDAVTDGEIVLSGIGVPGGDRTSPTLSQALTSDDRGNVSMVKRNAELARSSNVLELNGSPTDPLDYVADVEGGFSETYRMLASEAVRPELPRLLERFRGAEVRFVPRSTHVYSQVLSQSYHPDFLRSGIDRELFLLHLHNSAASLRDVPVELFQSEISQLLVGDVPYFRYTPESRSLRTGSGADVVDILPQSGLELALLRVAKLSERHLRRQLWLIRAAMRSVENAERLSVELREVPQASLDESAPGRRSAELACNRIIDRAISELASLASDDPEYPQWPSMEPQGERRWGLSMVGPDLYFGSAGISLFLTSVRDRLGVRERALARGLALGLSQHLRTYRDVVRDDPGSRDVGGFGSWSGAAYAVATHALADGDRERLEEVAALHADFLLDNSDVPDTDLISGLAGALRVAVALQDVAPDSSLLEAIDAAARSIATRAVRPESGAAHWVPDLPASAPLLGLSHGASGIALSLASAGALLDVPSYREVAADALRYEDRMFSVEAMNWPDLRQIGEGSSMHAWCHGSAGIALARLDLPTNPEFDEAKAIGTEFATKGLRKRFVDGGFRFMANHSVCHGNFGVAAAMNALASAQPSKSSAEDLHTWSRLAIESAATGGHWSAGPSDVELPGLMIGVSGVGLVAAQLLEGVAPVPSVLVLGRMTRGSLA